jgi:hypothetical protein
MRTGLREPPHAAAQRVHHLGLIGGPLVFVWEFTFAFWLIIKGFRPAADGGAGAVAVP